MRSLWKVFLANSNDLSRIAEITTQCRGKTFNLSKNKPGSFSFNMPLNTDWKSYLEPNKHCVIVQKDNDVVWSGPILTKQQSLASHKIEIQCVGWFNMLMTRYLTDGEVSYAGFSSDGAIAHNLLFQANSQAINGTPIPTWINIGTNTSTTLREIEFEQYKNIGEAIQELTEMEAGFDFEIDPVTRNMNITAWDDYVDRTDVMFGYNWGPHNLRDVGINTDGDTQRNQYYVVGESATAEAHTASTAQALEYGLHQEILQLSLDNLLTQAAIANAELAVNQLPRTLIKFDPHGETQLGNVPQLFTDYNLGDKCYLSAYKDGVAINGLGLRIFGVNFSIDENGNEKVSSIETTYNTSA